MLTVTGTLLDSSGNPVTARVAFQSQSTPEIFGLSLIVTNKRTVKTDPTTGNFSIALAVGFYLVTVAVAAGVVGQSTTSTVATQFTIAVPDGSGTVNIDTLITSPFQPLPGVPPSNVFSIIGGNITLQGTDLEAPNQTIVNGASLLTVGIADILYGGFRPNGGRSFRFKSAQLQLWDVAHAVADAANPWRALGVNNGQTVLSAPIAEGGALDNPYSPPGGLNYRFTNGQWQFWDNVAFVANAAKPWRAVLSNNGMLGWSAPINDAGAALDIPGNNLAANYRFKNGLVLLFDAVSAAFDLSRPWRGLFVTNGQEAMTQPISD